MLTANNLGAMLRGAKDYKRAVIPLLYPHGLAPTSPMVATNLGWLAMSQGDSAAAAPFFKAAIKVDARMSDALSGAGLIRLCSGNPSAALPLFRQSLMASFSDLAEAGVEGAEDDIASQAKKGATPNTGSPGVYGGKAAGEEPQWPDPPLPRRRHPRPSPNTTARA